MRSTWDIDRHSETSDDQDKETGKEEVMPAMIRSAERLTRAATAVVAPQVNGMQDRFAHRFTVKQYHKMIEAGILTKNDPVELLDGWIVEKMPRNAPHDASITGATRKLIRILPHEWLLRVQCALTLRTSEPEPDFTIVRGPDRSYSRRKPQAKDARLVMEVAGSSLLFDRSWKLQLYARARIPEYWVINVVDNCIEVYADPKGGKAAGYRRQSVYTIEQSVPLVLDGRHIADFPVRDLLPA
jgi:Uma2 family endonuclease